MAINTGAGPTDLSRLTVNNLDGEWLNYPRQKTGLPRRIWLWNETRELLSQEGYLLRNGNGDRISVEAHNNSLRRTWERVIRRAGVEHCQFYGIRRAFCLAADEARDPVATAFCMGHSMNCTTDLYRSNPSMVRTTRRRFCAKFGFVPWDAGKSRIQSRCVLPSRRCNKAVGVHWP